MKNINDFFQKAFNCGNMDSKKSKNPKKRDQPENENNQKHNQTNNNDQPNSESDMKAVVQECDSLKNSLSPSPEKQTQQQQIYNQNKSQKQDLKKEIARQIIQNPSYSESQIFSSVNSKNHANQNLDNRQNQENQNLNFRQNQANQNFGYCQNQANQSFDYHQNQANQNLGCYENQANQNYDYCQNQPIDYYGNQANQNLDYYGNQAIQSFDYYQNQDNQNLGYHENQVNQNFDYWQNQGHQNVNYYGNLTNNGPSYIRFQKGPIINIPKKFIPTIQRIDPPQFIYTEQIINQQPNQQDFQVRKEQSQPQIANYQQTENKKIRILQTQNNVNQNTFQNTFQPINSKQLESQYVNNYQPTNNNKNEYQQQSQIKQIDQSFHSFNSSKVFTEYKSCNYDNQSYAQTQLVKCYYCTKDIQKQYFQLSCQHFFCLDCLKECLKNQSKQIDCYAYKCLCSCVIKLQVLFKEREKDREYNILKEKLINNQLNALRLNIQKKYQLKICCNKCCQFFVILQQNLDHKYFYCPQCLERQVEVQLNQ